MLGPIFARECRTLPRQAWLYVGRCAYLAFLWLLAFTAWQVLLGPESVPTLSRMAAFSALLFELLATVQFALILFLSALMSVTAISREKDRRTFELLLVTDLSDSEIVLGKLFGSILPSAMLLLAAVPLMLAVTLLGGVGPAQVAQTTVATTTAALATAALGCRVALWRDRTLPALALTVMGVLLYVGVARALDAPLALDPYQVLRLGIEGPPGMAVWTPVGSFAVAMLGLGTLLTISGVRRLRVSSHAGRRQPEGPREPPLAASIRRRARPVWDNPILWREVCTRGYGRRPILAKLAYGGALALAIALGSRAQPAAAWTLVPVTILSLLLVAAQAVSAVAVERDSGALDVLLATDVTPGEFIFGKLGGIAYNVKEYVLAPLGLVVVHACLGQLATPPRNHPEMLLGRNIEAAACFAVALLVLFAFVAVLGLHVGLRNDDSRYALYATLAVVFLLATGTLLCVYLIVIQRRFEYQWISFVLFLGAEVAGLWWVLRADRPSSAITLTSWLCPLAIFYAVNSLLIGTPGSGASADPLLPFLVVVGVFGWGIAALLVPLLSNFDVTLGRTTAPPA
ncbi:MAG: ABC transporter permease [Gemmataceae bacterium]|nr:ABC transporter permease [Gemmataceae bacterium]MDW8266059.1 ABC transporter permease subunit [Gemmataceae bacterium]